MYICQAIDNIHILPQIIYVGVFIVFSPSISHDSMSHKEKIKSCPFL